MSPFPKIIGDVFESEQEMIHNLISHDYDSYQEFYEKTYPDHLQTMKTERQQGLPLHYWLTELERLTLEKIFKKRETISLEELKEYTGEYWVDPTSRLSMASRLLAVYEDFFHEDENFNQGLVRETKQYFSITKEDMKRARL